MGSVERHLLAKPFDNRRMDVIHPSDIIKPEWCSLAQYHALRGDYVETREKPALRLASIFAEGHTIHAKWQTWLQEMGVLYGYWQKGNKRSGPKLSSKVSSDHTYAEFPLTSAKHKMAGHTDGWVKTLGEDFLIEIKSIGVGTIRIEAPDLIAKADGDLQAAWRSIRRPFSTHVMQGQIYLELMRRLGHEVKEIVSLYELKADQDYKEFVIKADFELVESKFLKAKRVCEAVEAGTPLECSNNGSLGCKQCQQFGGVK
jgi:hypothetical protein